MKLRETPLKKSLLGLSAAMMSFAVGGCATLDQVGSRIDAGLERLAGQPPEPVERISLPPAERRDYRPGDVFIYGSDDVFKVMQSRNGIVVWGDTDGEVYRTTDNFFVPRIRQQYDDRIVSRRIIGDVDTLWPLQVGKTVSFTERRRTYWLAEDREDVTGRRWDCAVEDARVSVVPAGAYDSYRVTCSSYRMGRFSARNFGPTLTVSWDYAPKLGHIVREERTSASRSGTRIKRLSASIPAALATPRRVAAVLKRLENSEN